MKILTISVLIFTFLLLSFSQLHARELLVTADEVCVEGPPGSSGTVLYRVNPDTATAKEIGPVGFDGVGALAQIGDGRLIAGARGQGGSGNRTSLLIEINPSNGQGTLIGVSGSQTGPGCGRINDLTYDPVTDTLYGTAIQCDEGDSGDDFDVRLIRIDPDTGTQTIIGKTGFEEAGNALAINNAGTLFSSGCCTDGEQFFRLDPNTGVATLLATTVQGDKFFNSFVFNPLNGQLLGTNNGFPSTDLAIVDPLTGEFTAIGPLPDCADGMAFVRVQRNIPTLSQWGLIVTAGILGFVGIMVMRRRKATA